VVELVGVIQLDLLEPGAGLNVQFHRWELRNGYFLLEDLRWSLYGNVGKGFLFGLRLGEMRYLLDTLIVGGQ
jgi:hypothetical protein